MSANMKTVDLDEIIVERVTPDTPGMMTHNEAITCMKEAIRQDRQIRDESYNANFLWPHEDDSIEQLGYEFANAKTEEYQKECWESLKESLMKIRDEKVRGVLKEAKDAIQVWLDSVDCDCPAEGHICGRPHRERQVQKIQTLLNELE